MRILAAEIMIWLFHTLGVKHGQDLWVTKSSMNGGHGYQMHKLLGTSSDYFVFSPGGVVPLTRSCVTKGKDGELVMLLTGICRYTQGYDKNLTFLTVKVGQHTFLNPSFNENYCTSTSVLA